MKLRWGSQSISGTLTAMTLLVTGTALLLAYVSFLGYDLFNLRQSLIQSLETQSGIIGEDTVTALLFDDPKAAESTLTALRRSPNIVSASVFRNDGSLFARYVGPVPSKVSFSPGLEPSQRIGYWSDGNTILFGREIVTDTKVIGSVYILAETTDLSRRVAQFGIISAGILALCFLLALLVTARVRHLITRPLSSLADAARTVSRSRDYSVRADVRTKNEELNLVLRSFKSKAFAKTTAAPVNRAHFRCRMAFGRETGHSCSKPSAVHRGTEPHSKRRKSRIKSFGRRSDPLMTAAHRAVTAAPAPKHLSS